MVTVHKLGGDSGNEFFGTSPADQKKIEFFGGPEEDPEEYPEEDPDDIIDSGTDDEPEESELPSEYEEDEQPPKITTQSAQGGGAGGPNIVNLLSKDPLFMVLTQFLKNKNGNNIVEALDNINRNLERLNINLELSQKKAANKLLVGKKSSS
jgi:hypothetical protein